MYSDMVIHIYITFDPVLIPPRIGVSPAHKDLGLCTAHNLEV